MTREHQEGIERFGVRNPTYNLKKHSTLAEYRRALGEEKFHSLYKFTCARNPWERLVSYYFSPIRQAAGWDRRTFKKLVLKTLSVADYLQLGSEEDPFANVQRIMRFENLAEDFRFVCGELDLPPMKLPEYNRSSREHYSKYYDDELEALVRKRFAAEIERFDYVFEK